MIKSIWQIDLINPAGTHRLLDYGDVIAEEIKLSVGQSAAQYAPIGSAWGETEDQPGALVTLGWERRQAHATNIAARAFVLRSAASTVTRKTGTLRLSIQGGESWDIADATVTSSAPVTLAGGLVRTLTVFSAIGGRMSPAAAITLYAGIPWDFVLQDWEDVAADWEDL